MHYFYIRKSDIIYVIMLMNIDWRLIMENIETENKSEFYLHSLMCMIGGFLGGYAILNMSGNLASAQTSNMIYIILSFLGQDLWQFIIRVFGLLLYFAGIEIYVYITHRTKINVQRYGICVISAGCILLAVMPQVSDPVANLLPLFFILSTQWSIFHGAKGYNSSTIFSTNNFRQAALALGEYICTKEESHREKAKFFGNSLLWYHLGVAFSFFACRLFNVHASLFVLIPTAVSLLITYKKTKFVSVITGRRSAT